MKQVGPTWLDFYPLIKMASSIVNCLGSIFPRKHCLHQATDYLPGNLDMGQAWKPVPRSLTIK